jgi:hypothetical protein
MRRRAYKLAGLAALLLPTVAVAAAAPPTITANPTVVGLSTPLVLSGVVPGADEGELVEIEAKECTGTFFRLVGTARTGAGGPWRFQASATANTTFRVTSRGVASATVDVKHRIFVALARRSRTVVASNVFSPYQRMVGRTVRLERYTGGRWVLLRKAKLRRLAGPQSEARFLVSRRGMQLRAVVDTTNARPCHVAGVSLIIRS